MSSTISDLDPRVLNALISMPSYYVGRRVIDAGFASTYAFAQNIAFNDLIFDRNRKVAAEFTKISGISANTESGDSPGAYSYLRIPTSDPDTFFHAYIPDEEHPIPLAYGCIVLDEDEVRDIEDVNYEGVKDFDDASDEAAVHIKATAAALYDIYQQMLIVKP